VPSIGGTAYADADECKLEQCDWCSDCYYDYASSSLMESTFDSREECYRDNCESNSGFCRLGWTDYQTGALDYTRKYPTAHAGESACLAVETVKCSSCAEQFFDFEMLPGASIGQRKNEMLQESTIAYATLEACDLDLCNSAADTPYVCSDCQASFRTHFYTPYLDAVQCRIGEGCQTCANCDSDGAAGTNPSADHFATADGTGLFDAGTEAENVAECQAVHCLSNKCEDCATGYATNFATAYATPALCRVDECACTLCATDAGANFYPEEYADQAACEAIECLRCSNCVEDFATAFATAYGDAALCQVDECIGVCSDCDTDFATHFLTSYYSAAQCQAVECGICSSCEESFATKFSVTYGSATDCWTNECSQTCENC
jgi:hypothetical protein